MGKSKDLATGETRFVNTAGDTMTGNLAINNASGSQVTLHRSDTTIVNDDLVGQIIMSGDDADTDASGTRGYIRGRSQGTGGGLKMEFGTAGGGVAMGSDPRMTINADGYVTTPNQLHIFGTVKNTGGSGIANTFILSSNHPARGLSFSNSRIIVPIAGVYLITFHSISGNSAGGAREDTNVYVNGTVVTQSLSANNSIGYRKNGVSIAINLSANDYIQFDSDEWYSASNPAFDAWSTASVTLLG